MVVVSAPGKLILMGEHAAVYGRPAVTAAIGLRVRAELENGGGGGVELELPDLGVAERRGWSEIAAAAARARRRWRAFDEGAPFERDEDPAGLVRVALGEAMEGLDPGALPPLRLRVRSELPVGAGFGSSAAVAVAVIAGFLAWRGVDAAPERLERLALEVERRQHGRPSGIDHGTVLRGGVQWAGRDDAGELRLRPVAARPELLRAFRVYDSGSPAEGTGTVVAAVAERRRRDPERFERLLARMAAAASGLRAGLEASAAASGERRLAGVAEAIRDFERCLEEIGVVPPPVRRLIRRLEGTGGAAKVSGAGALSGEAAGCLLLFGGEDDPGPAAAGCERVDCTIGAAGLRVEAA